MISLWFFRQRLFENLRMLPHAPGVQMQATPEDAIPDDNVDEDTEDPDKRLSSTTPTHSSEYISQTFSKPSTLWRQYTEELAEERIAIVGTL